MGENRAQPVSRIRNLRRARQLPSIRHPADRIAQPERRAGGGRGVEATISGCLFRHRRSRVTVGFQTEERRRGGRRMSADRCEARNAASWSRRREHEVTAAIALVTSHAHNSAGGFRTYRCRWSRRAFRAPNSLATAGGLGHREGLKRAETFRGLLGQGIANERGHERRPPIALRGYQVRALGSRSAREERKPSRECEKHSGGDQSEPS